MIKLKKKQGLGMKRIWKIHFGYEIKKTPKKIHKITVIFPSSYASKSQNQVWKVNLESPFN